MRVTAVLDLSEHLSRTGPPPDLVAWRARKPVPSLPEGNNTPAREELLDVMRAAAWEGRALNYKVLTIWLAAMRQVPLTTATPRAHFNAARVDGVVQKLGFGRWKHVPSGDVLVFAPRFMADVVVDLHSEHMDGLRVKKPGRYNTKAAGVAASVREEARRGEDQRAAALMLTKELMGPAFGRDVWPLMMAGHGLLNMLQRRKVALLFDDGIVLADDPALAADTAWAGEGQRWVTIRGLRPLRRDASPPGWTLAGGLAA